jgi:hypothetical protein
VGHQPLGLPRRFREILPLHQRVDLGLEQPRQPHQPLALLGGATGQRPEQLAELLVAGAHLAGAVGRAVLLQGLHGLPRLPEQVADVFLEHAPGVRLADLPRQFQPGPRVLEARAPGAALQRRLPPGGAVREPDGVGAAAEEVVDLEDGRQHRLRHPGEERGPQRGVALQRGDGQVVAQGVVQRLTAEDLRLLAADEVGDQPVGIAGARQDGPQPRGGLAADRIHAQPDGQLEDRGQHVTVLPAQQPCQPRLVRRAKGVAVFVGRDAAVVGAEQQERLGRIDAQGQAQGPPVDGGAPGATTAGGRLEGRREAGLRVAQATPLSPGQQVGEQVQQRHGRAFEGSRIVPRTDDFRGLSSRVDSTP